MAKTELPHHHGEEKMNTAEIREVMLDMSSPAVSHHLRTLRDSGLIVSRREGKEVYYHAADNAQSRLLHEMIEQVMDIACPEWREEEE